MQAGVDVADDFAAVRREIADPARDSIAVEEYIYESNGPWVYRLQIIFKVDFFQNPEDGHCFYLRTPNVLRVWYRDKADRNLNILPPEDLDELINIDRRGILWEECWWPHYPEAGHKEPIRAIYAEVTQTPTEDPEVFADLFRAVTQEPARARATKCVPVQPLCGTSCAALPARPFPCGSCAAPPRPSAGAAQGSKSLHAATVSHRRRTARGGRCLKCS